ncbi:DgyrCDS48 [Dimorphilus gyrociliatus]|uniref:Polypeptide N-acetylgalactosaminyltransferase n=1 Tax=Dimorphilus gyrociliatus TaxID=2664684 RepID=A0A7I8V572_9ANNE|nr:DgyrCDS48 [Dimorphilus gyrociliatus]
MTPRNSHRRRNPTVFLKLWRRVEKLTVRQLFCLLFVLICLSLILTYSLKNELNNVRANFLTWSEEDANKIIKDLEAFIPSHCQSNVYRTGGLKSSSILINVDENNWRLLEGTLFSIQRYTDEKLIREIIVYDDRISSFGGEVVGKLVNACKSICKLLRSETKLGEASARHKMTQVAKGDVLVFIESGVLVTPHWMAPLLHTLHEGGPSIVSPRIDSIEKMRTVREMPEYKSAFTWSFSTMWTIEDGLNVLDGRVIAISRTVYEALGEYDPEFEAGGGANLDLSIRAMLCKVSIIYSECSRIGIQDAYIPRKVYSLKNFRRLTLLWFPTLRSAIYRLADINPSTDEAEARSIEIRKEFFRERQGICANESTLLGRHGVVYPDKDTTALGMLESQSTSLCIFAARNSPPSLTLCTSSVYRSYAIVSLNERKQLKIGSSCLNYHKTLKAIECGTLTSKWEFSPLGEIREEKTGKCLKVDGNSEIKMGFCTEMTKEKWRLKKL